jgi:hypothetical protein
MPALPPEPNKTIDLLYKKYEERNGDWRRPHLGASLIGKPCKREVWYNFRWCLNPNFSGRILRLFQTGFREEVRLVQDLRGAGITVYDRDPETGKQIRYESFGGHYAGSLDGMGVGFPEAEKSWHVIEVKTANTKTFNALKKHGVEKTKPEHYYQTMQYMSWSKADRAYYFCVCKETDDIYAERIYFDQKVADDLELKANDIVFADSPPEKLGDSDKSFGCKFCTYRGLCWDRKLPEVNCRTCAHSDVVIDGGWKCCRDGHIVSVTQQQTGCNNHIFIPKLVPLEVTDADEHKGTVTYGTITNGPGAVLSRDLNV